MATDERLIVESLFMIDNKNRANVPFILNKTQRALDDNFTGRDIIIKARQEGISSYYLALFTVRCLYRDNTRAVVISHDKESTERLFRKTKYFLENLRGPRAVLETSSKREISFPKTNSVFYIGTAGARKFGRGDTITDLHCSEVAFWENPKELLAGLFQAVPRSGTIGMESTGNGKNFFYRRVMSAHSGKGRYRLHFFNWIDFPEYDLSVAPEEAAEIVASLDPTLEEDVLYYETGLTPGQIKFRREKLEDLEYDLTLFKQEYPITLDECFRATGFSIFHKYRFVQTPGWERMDRDLYILRGNPRKDGVYGIGADVGGGVGQDRSVAEVFDLESGEQVAEWASDRTSPDVFAHRLAELGTIFNTAYITVESNNHGTTTLSELSKIYPRYKIHKKQIKSQDADNRLLSLGFYQTSRTKPLAIGTLRMMLATSLTIHSPELVDELGTFIEDESGKLGAEEGCFDDRVIACAVMAQTWQRASLLSGASASLPEDIERYDPFSLDSIIDEMTGRRRNFPIAPQAKVIN